MTTIQQQQSAGWLSSSWAWLREVPKAAVEHQSILWAVAVTAIVFDQATKWWVEANIPLYDSIIPLEFASEIFNFLHVKNPGAAFGMGQAYGWVFTTVAFIVTAGILFYNTVILERYTTFRISLGLILGGALGNVIDRFRIGEVTDFLNFDFRPWVSEGVAEAIPLVNFAIFNLADTFIFSGVCIMFWLMWKDTLPEDPWTEPEPETIDAAVVAAITEEAPDEKVTEVVHPQYELRTGPTNHTNWRQLENNQSEEEKNARFGLRSAIFITLAILLITFVVIRIRRNRK
ncbi:MAG: signal peptidase II [Chloroflexota bacterium]